MPINVGEIKCNGCGTCYFVCPKDCIKMLENEEGFLYPQINPELCIGCNLCERRCPILQDRKMEAKKVAYACINKNEEIRLKSSSGGIFSLIAEEIIKKGGVVFGAAFDKKFDVCHIAAESMEELEKLRCSKYVQSRIGDSYKQTKLFLDQNRPVLFTGTPCQIGGLKSYLGKEYNNLITQDIICHGVPSPMIWRKYVNYIEKKHNSKLEEVSFRYKNTGWNNYSVMFQFENGEEYVELFRKNWYMRVFLNNFSLRQSCYDCGFKSLDRQSDITLADFWGVNSVVCGMNDDKGTSLIIINSEEGERMFEEIKEKLFYKKVNLQEAIKHNISAVQSVSLPAQRSKFFRDIKNMQMEDIIKKYTRSIFIQETVRKCVLTLKRTVYYALTKMGIKINK